MRKESASNALPHWKLRGRVNIRARIPHTTIQIASAIQIIASIILRFLLFCCFYVCLMKQLKQMPKFCAKAPPSRLIRLKHFAFSPIEMTPARQTPFMLCSQFEVAQLIFSIISLLWFFFVSMPFFWFFTQKSILAAHSFRFYWKIYAAVLI